MIIGIGVDLVDIRRLERLVSRFGPQFVKRVFTLGERIYAEKAVYPVKAYANRFAAKEAAVKALGTGIKEGISWQDIEIIRLESGAPTLALYRRALEKLQSLVPENHTVSTHVSFSDEPPYSTAFVILSAVPITLG